jgi:hypothetical protein
VAGDSWQTEGKEKYFQIRNTLKGCNPKPDHQGQTHKQQNSVPTSTVVVLHSSFAPPLPYQHLPNTKKTCSIRNTSKSDLPNNNFLNLHSRVFLPALSERGYRYNSTAPLFVACRMEMPVTDIKPSSKPNFLRTLDLSV